MTTNHGDATDDRPLPCWLDGAWIDDAVDARVSPADPGWLRGVGAFATMCVSGGRPQFAARQWSRLRAGCTRLGIEADLPTDAQLDAIVAELLVRCATGDAGLAGLHGRLRVTRSAAHLHTSFAPFAPAERDAAVAPCTLALSPWRLSSTGATAGIKTTSYAASEIAFAVAARVGAADALVLNERGEVAETARANVFAVIGGAIVTPPATAPDGANIFDPTNSGALAGTTRGVLIDAWAALGDEAPAPMFIRPLPLAELLSAEALVITNATRGVSPVERLVDLATPARFAVTPFDPAHSLLHALRKTWVSAVAHDAAGRC